MRHLFFAFASGLLASCASVPDEEELYGRYAEYAQELNPNNVKERYSDFFSQSLVGADIIDDQGIAEQLLFSNLMRAEVGHAEMIDGSSGCLTINGYDEENLPLVFSMQYSHEGQWLISGLHIAYLNDPNDFDTTAKCPNEYLDQSPE